MKRHSDSDLETTKVAIGGGTFGAVAYDNYNPKIAIKTCKSDSFASSLKETSVLSYLSHVGIIKPLSINYSLSGECKIFMERYEGSLRGGSWLESAARIRKSPSTLLLRILCDISAAVSYMHGCGIIHADLKTANILYRTISSGDDYTLQPVICDFNTSIIEVNKFTYTHIQTLIYRAPEVNERFCNSITGDITTCFISEKIDVWSIGCIAYEMFTGDVFMAPKNGRTPSWLATIDAIFPQTIYSEYNNEYELKLRLFATHLDDIATAVEKRILLTQWKSLMKLKGQYGRRNKEIAKPMFNLYVDIISKCLIPNPNNRLSASDLHNYLQDICVDIRGSPPGKSTNKSAVISNSHPRFKISFFDDVITRELEKITQYGDKSDVYLSNYAKLYDVIGDYKSVYLMGRIIELKYYEKKRTQRLMNESGFQTSLAACLLAGILTDIDDIDTLLRPHAKGTYLMEVVMTLSGDLL